jgi:two-component system, sensor histidine kinase PdtaS
MCAKLILLVEDEVIIAMDTAARLEQYNYSVHYVHSGSGAIERIERGKREGHPYDLVLMDIDLGDGIDGTQTAKAILEKHDIPIVFLTSHAERAMVERVRNITRYGYVLKSAGDFVLASSIDMAFELFSTYKKRKNHELELKSLFDNAPIPMVLVDGERRIRRFNRNFAEYGGEGHLVCADAGFGSVVRCVNALENPKGCGFAVHCKDCVIRKSVEQVFKTRQAEYKIRGAIPVREEDSISSFEFSLSSNPIDSNEGMLVLLSFIDISEQIQNEDAYKKLKIVADYTNDWEYLVDSRGILRYISPSVHRITGYSKKEFIEEPDLSQRIVHPEDAKKVTQHNRTYHTNVASRHADTGLTFRIITKEGETRWIHHVCRSAYDEDNRYVGRRGSNRDVTEKIIDEQKIHRLLEEKELLLREVHHRIKNNMTTIASLLSLRSQDVKDDKAREILEEAYNRVATMMLIYDSLYRGGDYHTIDVKEYLSTLIERLRETFGEEDRIQIECTLDDISLDAKTAFPIGIVVNELITNAYKHAFPENREGTITVELSKRKDSLDVWVQDDGIGIPEKFIDRPKEEDENDKGFGNTLLHVIAEQLGGELAGESGERGSKIGIRAIRTGISGR